MNYEFASPGKTYKKVKVVKLRLFKSDGTEAEHQIGVYLHASGTPTFCITVPGDYWDTWINHPPKSDYLIERAQGRLDQQDKIIRATTFDAATEMLTDLSMHWRQHYANRTMEKCIYVLLELRSSQHSISPPSFSGSRTLVGLTVRWGYRVAGKEYKFRNGIDDPVTAVQPEFKELQSFSGATNGKKVTLPFTPDLWREIQKIKETLERAADRLALLAETDSAVALLTSLATGTPLLAAH